MNAQIKIATTTDQIECFLILKVLGVTEQVVPKPPNKSCAAITEIAGLWMVIENNGGCYRIHAIQDATEEEAFKFYDSLFVDQSQKSNPRLIFTESNPSQVANN